MWTKSMDTTAHNSVNEWQVSLYVFESLRIKMVVGLKHKGSNMEGEEKSHKVCVRKKKKKIMYGMTFWSFKSLQSS